MTPERQLRARKISAWANLVAGSLILLGVVRDIYAPGLLQIHSHQRDGFDMSLQLLLGSVFLISAILTFVSTRRNPDNISQTTITTLFGGSKA